MRPSERRVTGAGSWWDCGKHFFPHLLYLIENPGGPNLFSFRSLLFLYVIKISVGMILYY